ncbi:hypothetical protein GXW71_10050 [Roseomonas hellenica]|uniref:Uncharacterized protein n=1 Tax=Plastoroseomonas hellenica TaxID=2687306 RepID=A0ABS5EWM5_9PROT|nr:hypothetical protein [Plastoroseomonas hellenica]MBR0664693.1 hypothetical protein [Plastoroseomonas hellenica]
MHAFLRDHYDVVREVLDRPTPKWRACALWLAKQDVVGAQGQAPSADSLRQMWPVVKREVEADRDTARRRAEKRARKRPNRSPRHAGPPPVTERAPAALPEAASALEVPLQAAPAPSGRVLPASPMASNEIELTPEAEAKFAALREQLAHADRYLGPQPKRKSG